MAEQSYTQLATTIYTLIPDVPANLSGTAMIDLIYRKALDINNYTGLNCGSPNVAERFQAALINLSCAEILRFQALQGIKVASFSLGDFSINKGSSSAISDASDLYQTRGEEELKRIGRRTDFYVAY